MVSSSFFKRPRQSRRQPLAFTPPGIQPCRTPWAVGDAGAAATRPPRHLGISTATSITTVPRPSPTARGAMEPTIFVSSIQDFRDGFRALFLPGFAIVTFSLPLILIGFAVNSTKRGGGSSSDNSSDSSSSSSSDSSSSSNNGRLTKATTANMTPNATPSPAPLPPLSGVLLFKLLASILIDLVGDGSLLVPGAGDASDLLWAPLSAVLVRLLYGSNTLAAVNFLEELLPLTDAIPTATIAFLLDYFFWKAEAEDAAKRRAKEDKDVVDVRATRVDDDDRR